MAKRDYHIISSDSHTLEPPDLWETWLEKKYRDTAPKLVEDKDGGHGWLYMGATTPEPLGLVSCVGTRPEELKWTGARYGKPTNPAAREIHPGCYLGDQRLELMDVDGVDAEILYPPQRAMLTFMRNKDVDAHLAGIRAYNRWLKEGFCAPDPRAADRHLPDPERRHRDQCARARARQEGGLQGRCALGVAVRR